MTPAHWLQVILLLLCGPALLWGVLASAGRASRREEAEEAAREADLAKGLRPLVDRHYGVEHYTRDELLELAHHEEN